MFYIYSQATYREIQLHSTCHHADYFHLMSTFWHGSMRMFNVRTAAVQNCNNPTFVKNFLFHIFRVLNIHKFHPEDPFPIKWPICIASTIWHAWHLYLRSLALFPGPRLSLHCPHFSGTTNWTRTWEQDYTILSGLYLYHNLPILHADTQKY